MRSTKIKIGRWGDGETIKNDGENGRRGDGGNRESGDQDTRISGNHEIRRLGDEETRRWGDIFRTNADCGVRNLPKRST